MRKFIYSITTLLVFFSVFIIIGGKFENVGKKFLYDCDNEKNYSYGDLYAFCEISKFKQKINLVESKKEEDSIESADVILMGDSFFGNTLETEIFANELEKRLQTRVFHIPSHKYKPLSYFQESSYNKSERKILIIEVVERNFFNKTGNILNEKNTELPKINFLNTVGKKIFMNKDIEYFYKHNIIISSLRIHLKEKRFTYLKEIDDRIGSYSENPPMLFLKRAVVFNKTTKTEKQTDQTIKNIVSLNEILKNEYNIELIFVIIPNKYSIYSDYTNDNYTYDNFIPKINKKLDEMGVKNIDLYSKYIEYRVNDNSKLLYYPNDTHYSLLGKNILINEIITTLQNIF